MTTQKPPMPHSKPLELFLDVIRALAFMVVIGVLMIGKIVFEVVYSKPALTPIPTSLLVITFCLGLLLVCGILAWATSLIVPEGLSFKGMLYPAGLVGLVIMFSPSDTVEAVNSLHAEVLYEQTARYRALREVPYFKTKNGYLEHHFVALSDMPVKKYQYFADKSSIQISSEMFGRLSRQKLEPGDPLAITISKGWLGIPFVADIAKLEPNDPRVASIPPVVATPPAEETEKDAKQLEAVKPTVQVPTLFPGAAAPDGTEAQFLTVRKPSDRKGRLPWE